MDSALLGYSVAFINWRKPELQAIDRKTRKLFIIYGGLHPKSDVDILYIPRRDGGRGLIASEDCVELAVTGLEVFVHGSEERLLQAAKGRCLRSSKCFEKSKEREETARLGGESFIWPVFETN